MWRLALVGLLATAATACGKKPDDGPAVVAGAPAGTVVELEGTVTANGKPLAKGATVAGDDLVETGEGARVAIELAHNHARWTLGQNKHEKPRESKAWAMAKVEGSAAGVDQTATSAGRDGERRAAETDVTTTIAPSAAARDPESAPPTAVAGAPGSGGPPPAAAQAAPNAPPPATAHTGAPGGSPTAKPESPAQRPMIGAPKMQPHDSKPTAPPPPPMIQPPPPPPPSDDDPPVRTRGGGGEDRVMSPSSHGRQIVVNDAELKACVKAGSFAHVTVTCTEKSCKLDTSDAAAACLAARFAKLAMPKADYEFQLDITAPAR